MYRNGPFSRGRPGVLRRTTLHLVLRGMSVLGWCASHSIFVSFQRRQGISLLRASTLKIGIIGYYQNIFAIHINITISLTLPWSAVDHLRTCGDNSLYIKIQRDLLFVNLLQVDFCGLKFWQELLGGFIHLAFHQPTSQYIHHRLRLDIEI